MRPQPDYLWRGWKTVGAVLLLLVVVSFIPPVTIGGITLRRANIFADLYSFDDSHSTDTNTEVVLFDEEEFAVDLEAVSQQIEADTTHHEIERSYEWILAEELPDREPITFDSRRYASGKTPIEDFSADGRFASFCDTLIKANRTVRIAVLGDSFIEGDILTADLRERLQAAFGGRGTGFAPMASPLTAYRRTVKTLSKGWTTYNVMQHKSTPEAYKGQFFVSGWVCRPTNGASTHWSATDYRNRLDSCSTARVLLLSPSKSRVELIVNDSLSREFSIEGAEGVRQLMVQAPAIHSLEFRVKEGAETMVAYGAMFEHCGVEVDNYSIRSNNGQAIFRTNPAINAQVNSLVGYDLVILQYGLNIMQQGVLNYENYGTQIEKIVAYVRECFPSAAVLVLSVSDRAVKNESGVESMDAIPAMIDCQRTAARNCGAAFWSTYDAMRAEGGIEQFVSKGWAGKDYTHINYAGGRRVAWALFDAINAEAIEADERERRRIEQSRLLAMPAVAEQPLFEGVSVPEAVAPLTPEQPTEEPTAHEAEPSAVAEDATSEAVTVAATETSTPEAETAE